MTGKFTSYGVSFRATTASFVQVPAMGKACAKGATTSFMCSCASGKFLSQIRKTIPGGNFVSSFFAEDEVEEFGNADLEEDEKREYHFKPPFESHFSCISTKNALPVCVVIVYFHCRYRRNPRRTISNAFSTCLSLLKHPGLV